MNKKPIKKIKINNHPLDKRKDGFTIIELLIATAVFSVVLMVFLAAFLRISQLFYKGVNMSNTQETARNVLQDISDDLQFYNQAPVIGSGYFCIGNHRYAYNIGSQVGSSGTYGIARENMNVCKPLLGAQGQAVAANHTELLDPGMQVNLLNITPQPDGVINVAIRLVFYGGDNSVLVSPSGATPAYKAADAQCSGPANSTQFCATADYNSTILQSF